MCRIDEFRVKFRTGNTSFLAFGGLVIDWHTLRLKRSSKTYSYSSTHGSDATSVVRDLVLVCWDTVQKVVPILVRRCVRGDGLLQYCRTSARTKHTETKCRREAK